MSDLPQPAGCTAVVPRHDGLMPLATGGSDVAMMRRKGYLFIDKTALLPDLVAKWHVFVARPQGFGKSLLISMLEELFTHGAQSPCFDGLAVQKEWNEPICEHVLVLSFTGLYASDTFEADVCNMLRRAFYQAGFAGAWEVVADSSKLYVVARYLDLLRQDAEMVVLIDDWDEPLSLNLGNHKAFAANKAVLDTFYAWLRDLNGVRFSLVTGVGRYFDSMFFGGHYLNDISHISNDPAFAGLFGYTEADLQQYFGPYITRASARLNMSEEQLFAELKSNYGGFCFDEDAAVTLYHPFAINYFFAQLYYTSKVPPVFESFWCDSPRSIRTLRTFFEEHYPELAFLETVKSQGITLMQDALNSAVAFDHIRFATLLVQQGYLSIKANLTPNEGDSLACQLHCIFTNTAAEDLYHSVLVGYLTQSQTNAADAAMILKMLQIAPALREGDWRGLVEGINFFLDQLRTSSYSGADAAKYRSMLTSFLCYAIGSAQVCAPSYEGRADVEVLVDDSIFALELKLAPSTASPEDYPKLASNLRLNKTTYNRMVRNGSSSDFGYLLRAIKHWYGLVLVLDPQSHRICYWRAFSPRKEQGAGLVPAAQS